MEGAGTKGRKALLYRLPVRVGLMSGQRDHEGWWVLTGGLSESRLRMALINKDKASVKKRRGTGNLKEKVRVLHCTLRKETA